MTSTDLLLHKYMHTCTYRRAVVYTCFISNQYIMIYMQWVICLSYIHPQACMLVNISPLDSNIPETISTLEFGQNVRQVELGKATKHVTRPVL